MTNTVKFITALSVGGVLISSAAGFMVVNAQSATAASPANMSHNGKPKREQLKTQMDSVKIALDNKDYTAWKAAIANVPNGAQILAKVDTQEKFTKLSEAHIAVKTAHETEQKVRTELGLDGIMGPGNGKGKKMIKDHYENFRSINTPTKAN